MWENAHFGHRNMKFVTFFHMKKRKLQPSLPTSSQILVFWLCIYSNRSFSRIWCFSLALREVCWNFSRYTWGSYWQIFLLDNACTPAIKMQDNLSQSLATFKQKSTECYLSWIWYHQSTSKNYFLNFIASWNSFILPVLEIRGFISHHKL